MFISGSDEHGVAIMLNADKAGKDFQSYVNEWHVKHKNLFQRYKVDFDFFGQTSSDYHAEEVTRWFHKLYEAGLIGTKDNQQLQCNDCGNHLPDRFVEGICYECGFEHARGDECPMCGTWIDAVKLKSPVCKICESQNIKEVTVTQYYLLMEKFHEEYRSWFCTKANEWRKTVYPFLDALTKEALHDRAISRDLKWGIDVPLAEAKGKKLYVWFDAPIGYVSNTKKYLEKEGGEEHYLNDWWNNEDTEIVNFIGKDNIIFHGVIFPIMSLASKIAKPVTNLPANMYVNLEGKPFSKSTGWYVDADRAVESFGSDALRYYLISLIPESADTSFCWDNFAAKVNNELANNIGNLVNRCLKFWTKNWPEGIDGRHFHDFADSEYGKKVSELIGEHAKLLDGVSIKKALDVVMNIGHEANNFFSDKAPWAQFKDDAEAAAETIAWTSQYILILGVLLAPYLPELSSKILAFYGDKVDDELKVAVYRGDLSRLRVAFAANNILASKPKALVPKIDLDLVEKLKGELQSKASQPSQ